MTHPLISAIQEEPLAFLDSDERMFGFRGPPPAYWERHNSEWNSNVEWGDESLKVVHISAKELSTKPGGMANPEVQEALAQLRVSDNIVVVSSLIEVGPHVSRALMARLLHATTAARVLVEFPQDAKASTIEQLGSKLPAASVETVMGQPYLDNRAALETNASPKPRA